MIQNSANVREEDDQKKVARFDSIRFGSGAVMLVCSFSPFSTIFVSIKALTKTTTTMARKKESKQQRQLRPCQEWERWR